MASPLSFEPAASFEALRTKWADLTLRSGNIFASWEWSALWWRHFGAGRRLALRVARRSEGGVSAILPLYAGRVGPLRLLRFMGHGPGDQLGPVCGTSEVPAVAAGLRDMLGTSAPAHDLFIGERLPGDQRWGGRLNARVVRREASPLITVDGQRWEEFLASRSRNLRQEVRRDERRLARDHHLRFRLADDGARLGHDLAELYRLHVARWPSSRFGRLWPFHQEFARLAFQRGWLRLWFLEIDGRHVAARYGFRYGDVQLQYQAGWDPAWARASVGLVLTAHTIRQAFQDGVREYRFLRGGEDYKYRFATADPGLETIAIPRGPLGRAGLSAAEWGSRTPLLPFLRRRLYLS